MAEISKDQRLKKGFWGIKMDLNIKKKMYYEIKLSTEPCPLESLFRKTDLVRKKLLFNIGVEDYIRSQSMGKG